jgi:putative N6-adenine-specific DNA methylase
MPAESQPLSADAARPGIVVCRGGLEEVVAAELKALGIRVLGVRKRAVDIETDLGGIYRANMALRCALNVLVPIRSFNARNYDLLYYQSRKTNWHKLFPADARLRIDVKGHSNKLTHTRYVIHRVKDGISINNRY